MRHEIDAVIECFVGALLNHVPLEGIAGIYVKGSAAKAWDSPVDYVPELSDVDIQLLLNEAVAVERRLGDLQVAFAVRSGVESSYSQRVPDAIHFPKVQFIVLNRLLADPAYCPSPPGTVHTVYGDPLCEHFPETERVRALDRERLLALSPRVQALPLRVIDKPASRLREILGDLAWQLSPTGPRVLTLLGVDPAQAWSANRTGVVALLEEKGEAELAGSYGDFYLSGWDYFLSGYRDTGAAEAATIAFSSAMARALAIAAEAGA